MTVNKAQNLIKDRPVQTIKRLEREQQAIKTRQLLGGDNLPYDVSGEYIIIFPTTLDGQQDLWFLEIDPSPYSLFSGELAYDIYIDNDNDPNYVWPDGPSLSSAEIFGIDVHARRRLIYSNDTTGYYEYLVRVSNQSGSTHAVYVHAKLIYLARPLTA